MPMPSSHAMRQRRPGTRVGANVSSISTVSPRSALQLRLAVGRQRPAPHYIVFERADGIDGDANPVASSQRKLVRRHNAGSCHQKHTERKAVFEEKILCQLEDRSLELRQRCRSAENLRSLTRNLDMDWSSSRQGFARHQNARPQRATAVVDLCLWKIERVLALDVARAHIVA